VVFVNYELETFIPKYIIEYKGKTHKDSEQIAKDKLKRELLEEVGLAVIEINDQKFNELNNIFKNGGKPKFPEDFLS